MVNILKEGANNLCYIYYNYVHKRKSNNKINSLPLKYNSNILTNNINNKFINVFGFSDMKYVEKVDDIINRRD